MIYEMFKIPPDERIVLKFRKHWFILFTDSIGTVLVGVAPYILFSFLATIGLAPTLLVSPAIIAFASSWWFIVIWCAFAVIWTDYYLDVWIVTERRVININQISLFDRQTSHWSLDRIQDVTVGMHNIFETLLKFGSIEVHTAGPAGEFTTIRGVKNPDVIQQTIMREVDRFTEETKRATVERL